MQKITNLKKMLDNTYDLYKDNILYRIKDNDNYKVYTHGEIRDKIKYLSTLIINEGFKRDKIAVIGDNSMNWEMAYLAICSSDNIVVPIDKTLPLTELKRIIKVSGAKWVFTFAKNYDVFLEIKKEKDNDLQEVFSFEKDFESLILKGKKIYQKNPSLYEDVQIETREIASLLFTSGTTASSKEVALSHENLCTNITDLKKHMQIKEKDIFLSFLPVHHAFECTFGFLLPYYSGSCITFADGIRHITANLKEYHASVMACVPAVYEMILKGINKELNKLGILEDYQEKIKVNIDSTMEERKKMFPVVQEMMGGNIKYLISGAAYLNVTIEKSFRDYGLNLMQGYGLTETSPVVCMCSNKEYRLGSVGKILPSVDVRIDSPNDEGIGEITVKGQSIMLGYYENGEFNRDNFKDDYFYTGDLGRKDNDNFLYICGRKKDTIVLKNGKNIYPEEIEYLLNKIPGVKECLVYSLTKDGEDVKINAKLVIDKKEIRKIYHIKSDDEIYDALFFEVKKVNKMMPEYKAIKNIIITEEPLIRTSTNKIKRQENLLYMNLKEKDEK